MKKDGLRPDIVSYTTVIDAYKRQRNITKCWDLYETYAQVERDGKQPDEFLLTYMIRLCAATHDSEKAILMFNQMEANGYTKHAMPFNAIIFALASTERYAEQALDYWHRMHLENITPDSHTFVAALKACSQLGDINTANDILHEMKVKKFPLTEHVYNELIRTYGMASAVEGVKEEHVDMYINDAWSLLNNMIEVEGLEPNIHILNSMAFLYARAARAEELEARVLPLYDKYRIKHDVFTYQHLTSLYLATRDLKTVMSLYDRLKEKEQFKPNKKLLHILFETSMRLKDSDRIV